MKRTDLLIGLLVLSLLASGCWGKREMESQAYILVLGIDQGGKGYKIYAQVGTPIETKGEGKESEPIETLTADGRDLTEAINSLFLRTTKSPDLSHLQMLIFSKELAAGGIQPALDFLRRNLSIRENIRVVVAGTKIEDLLKTQEKLGNQPALAIINQFQVNTQRSVVVQTELKDLLSHLLEPDREAVLPLIGSSEDHFTLGESAVFQGYKMVDTLTQPETLGLLLWQDRVINGSVTIPQGDPNKVASFRVISSKTKVKVSLKGDQLQVRAQVDAVLDLEEMVDQKAEELEKYAKHYFVNRLYNTLQIAKDKGDFLDLGAVLRRQDLKGWQRVKEKWKEVLEQGEFDLRCRVEIRGQGPVR